MARLTQKMQEDGRHPRARKFVDVRLGNTNLRVKPWTVWAHKIE